jgi:hypothetical protein
LLDAFPRGVADVLGDELAGVYLHGSVALGSFDSVESDVDFLVATERELGEDEVERLAALHVGLGDRLDGSYLPREVFRRFDPERVIHPHIESRGGQLALDHHGGETVIYRHVLRECGLTLFGPPPRELIDPTSGADLRWGVCDVLTNWWAPMLADPPAWVQEEQYRHYAVVTMCRVRFTLERSAVVSKPEAAKWAAAHVDVKWRDLVARAAVRGSCGYEETMAFVRETLEAASC